MMMKQFIIVLWCVLVSCSQALGDINDINIVPYIASGDECGVSLSSQMRQFLLTKMERLVLNNGIAGGINRRFIITPKIHVISQEYTVTAPPKVVVITEITMFVGDGINGELYGSYSQRLRGVGDTSDGALKSALLKIKDDDMSYVNLLNGAKQHICEYYNKNGKTIIENAEGQIAQQEYEQAIYELSLIPQGTQYYDEAQKLIRIQGHNIIERDNAIYLMKAKNSWASSPDSDGASTACDYISKIRINSPVIKSEIESFLSQIGENLKLQQARDFELKKIEIETNASLEKAEKEKTAAVATSFIETLPSIIYNIANWLIF